MPREYGPPKILDNRSRRWSGLGGFAQTMKGIAPGAKGAKDRHDRRDLSGSVQRYFTPTDQKGGRKGHRAHRREHEPKAPCHRRHKPRDHIKIMFGRFKDRRRMATR